MNIFKAGLASCRLTNILVSEKIAIPIREFLGIYHDNYGNPTNRSIHIDSEIKIFDKTLKGKYLDSILNFFAKAIQCPYCTSIWVSLFLTILYYVNKRLFNLVVNTLAISHISTLFL